MKNLKKVLALALAVIMMMSLFTVAFAAETETKLVASDFTDWNEVEYKDAVALCVDLGIISGISNGDGTYKFAPKDNIDRASWAKLIYFIATGDDNADAFKGANVGMSDISTSWAEGFIAYCVANGYAAGDGQGNYLPANNMTVAAGLKTLLNVLGWDPDDRGYQGTLAWSGNVMTDAKAEGLMDDVDKANTANVNLTREVAAQIIYNALQAQTVEPNWGRDNGEKFVSSYNKNQGLLCAKKFGVYPIEVTVRDVAKGEIEDCSVATGDVPAAVTASNTTIATNIKNAGVKASILNQNEKVLLFIEKDGTVVSTSVASASSSADAVFTGGVSMIDVLGFGSEGADEDDYVGDPASTYAVYVDGAKVTGVSAPNGSSDIDETTTTAYSYLSKVVGNRVEVYTDSNGDVETVKVTTYTANQLTGDVETRTYSGKLQVKVPGVTSGWKNADLVEGYQGLVDDDYVIYNTVTKNSTTSYYITKADKITGSVTKRAGTGASAKLTIDGTAYKQSGITNVNGLNFDNWDVSGNKENVYDFYLDLNGTIIAYKLVEGKEATEWAYVLQAKWLENTASWDSDSSVQVKLLFADGTTEVVTVSAYTDTNGTEVEADRFTNSGTTTTTSVLQEQLVKYYVDKNGEYELTLQTTADESRKLTIAQKPAFNDNGTTIVANNATVFLVEKVIDSKTTEYYSYTGYKNVPAMTATTMKYALKDSSTTATYVFLSTTKFDGDGSDGLVYLREDSDCYMDASGDTVYTLIDADGNKIEAAVVFATGTSASDSTFYRVTSIDDDGVLTLAAHGETEKTNDFASGDGVITTNNTQYAYDDETIAILIEMDRNGDLVSAGSFSLDNFEADTTSFEYKSIVIADGKGNAEYVYVTCKADA